MAAAAQSMTQQPTFELQGVQKPALQAIQNLESPVVAVMPTGGGKSLLFMLPAFLEPNGTTIVVVPLIALRQDFMQWCKQLNIKCEAWNSQRHPDQASIVLATPESATTDAFSSFIGQLRKTNRLDQIVID
ncbi:hypothetical protein H4S06_000001, partial [Coemansia sp. BCRC 34490]